MKPYIDANIVALKALKAVIQSVDTETYQKVFKPAFQSSLGQHARHIIEHYQCFFKQLKSNDTFNYDLRCRDPRLDTDYCACIAEIDAMLNELESFRTVDIDITVCDDYSQYQARSSVCRELMFLVTHTEHHSAMIAAMKRLSGQEVPAQFGVANATLNHEERVRCGDEQVKKAAQ